MKTFPKTAEKTGSFTATPRFEPQPGATATLQNRARIVSSPNERLILVDERDSALGDVGKLDCHLGGGQLHRAFSLHVINSKREVLLQCRSRQKLLWPGFWSNSCCSHPRSGETLEDAVHRRAKEELGLTLEIKYLYKFRYKARYLNVGTEKEICSVFVGYSDEDPIPNPNELSDWQYVKSDAVDKALKRMPGYYTPWFRMEWARLQLDFPDLFQRAG